MPIPRMRASIRLVIVCLAALLTSAAHATRTDIAWMRGGHGSDVYQVEPLAGGQTLASIGGDGMLKLSRSSDGMLLRSVGIFSQRAFSLAVSPDGATIAVGGTDWVTYGQGAINSIKLLRAADLSLLRTISLAPTCSAAPGQLAFSPDGSLLASAGYNGQACGRLWRVSDGTLASDLSYVVGTTTSNNLGGTLVAFSPDGQYLATDRAGDYAPLMLYRIADGAVFTFGPRTAWAGGLAFSPSGGLIATTAGDGVRVYGVNQACRLSTSPCSWRTADGTTTQDSAPPLMQSPGFNAVSPRFSPDGSLLAIGGNSSAAFANNAPFIKLWSVAGWTPLRAFATGDEYGGTPPAPAFSADGQFLFSAGKTLRQWRVGDGALVYEQVPNSPLNAIAVSGNGQVVATGDNNNTSRPWPNAARLWRTSDGTLLQTLIHDGLNVPCYMTAAISADGSLVATACAFNADGNVKIWRVSDGALLTTIGAGAVSALAFSIDGATLALGYGSRGSMELRAVSDGTVQKSFNFSSTLTVSAIAASPNGQQWAAAHNGGVTLFRSDAVYGTELTAGLMDGSGMGARGMALAFSPDGSLVYAAGTASSGGGVPKAIGWRVSDGSVFVDVPFKVDATTAANARAIRSASFSPDLAFVATSGDDATIRFWRVADGAPVAMLDQETGNGTQAGMGYASAAVQASAFSADGRMFIYGRGDAVIVAASDPIASLLNAVTSTTTTSSSTSTTTSATTSTTTSSTTTTTTSTTTTSTTTSTTLALPSMALIAGWNLVGNGVEAPIAVANLFGDATKVTTVWKWVAAKSTWAFYTPQYSDGGQSYATGKGYDFLSTIGAGEGFWVNAKTGFSVPLPSGALIQSSTFRPAVASPPMAGGSHALPSGWSLIATGDGPTPALFDAALAQSYATPPGAGQVYLNLSTMWAWNAANGAWYFWAPSLANNGQLAGYIASKAYLDFATLTGASPGTLSPTTGFWVNMP